MPNTLRAAAARLAASKYAPKPNGSALTYGFISLTLVALALVFFSVFYGIDLLIYPVSLTVAAVLAFLGGVVFRKRGKRRHREAVAREYELRGHDAPTQ